VNDITNPVLQELFNGRDIANTRPVNCKGCPYKSRTCNSRGPIDSPFVIVGESPGKKEVARNLPFIGDSGVLLKKVLQEVGLNVEPFITNAVQCMPKEKDVSNLKTSTHSCANRVRQEIALHPRKVILALGNAAVWSVTGNYDYKITQIRGQQFATPLAENGIIACVHPAAILRGGYSMPLFKRDCSLAVEMIKGKSSLEYVDADCMLMETERDIRNLIDIVSPAEYIACDIETHDLKSQRGRILSIGFCVDPKTGYIVPPHLFKYLGDIFKRGVTRGKWIYHFGKFDIGWLRYEHDHHQGRQESTWQLNKHFITEGGTREGYDEARVDEDTGLLSYAIEETRGIHGLEQIAASRLGAPDWKAALDSWLPKKDSPYSLVPPLVLYRYQAKDLSSTLQVFHKLRPLVKKDSKLELCYTKSLLKANEICWEMESNGMSANRPQFVKNRNRWTKVVELSKARVNKHAKEVLGREINPGSWQQVQKLLYVGGLDLANGKVLSTNEQTLTSTFVEGIVDEKGKPKVHPAVEAIIKYRGYKKTLGTYIDGIEESICPDNKVHQSILIHGTTSGRFASKEPNMFNIQRILALRNQFMAEVGYILMELDLNQAELRSLAVLSNDPDLCRIYETAGKSIHKIVSEKFFGKGYNHEQYMRAKAVTFGIVYGREAFSLAQEFKISVQEAQKYIDAWFAQFPVAEAFINECRKAPLQGKILQTMFGYKRRFGPVGHDPMRIKAIGNEAANFPHQSIAASITAQGAIDAQDQLRRWGVRMVNLVYDGLYLEIPMNDDLIQETYEYTKATMEAVPQKWGITRIPFIAEAKTGIYWGKMKEYPPPEKKAA